MSVDEMTHMKGTGCQMRKASLWDKCGQNETCERRRLPDEGGVPMG